MGTVTKKHHSQRSEGEASNRQAGVLLAEDPETLERAYDEWARDYDRDLVELSGSGDNEPGLAATRVLVQHFFFFEEHNNRVLDKQQQQQWTILDFGCGTGRAGLFLKEQGLLLDANRQLDGCDLSRGMLDIAAQRNIYRNLIKADFYSSHCETNKYDIVHASGVFAPGQAPPSAFDEFLQLLKPSGHAVFTIRVGYYDSEEGAAHRDRLEQLETEGKWITVTKREVPYLPSDGVNAYVFIMKKT